MLLDTPAVRTLDRPVGEENAVYRVAFAFDLVALLAARCDFGDLVDRIAVWLFEVKCHDRRRSGIADGQDTLVHGNQRKVFGRGHQE